MVKISDMSVWDLLAWFCLAGIFVWLVLKTFGIINSPAWLEYAPIYGAVYMAGWAVSKLNMVSHDVEILKSDMGRLKGDMLIVKSDLGRIKEHCPNC